MAENDEWGEGDYNPNNDEQEGCSEPDSSSAESGSSNGTLSSSSSEASLSAPPPNPERGRLDNANL